MPARPPIVINRSGLHFTDKVTIITGGAKGIGEGCVRVFVDAGAWVVFLDRDEAAGKQLETELSGSAPGECKFLAGDIVGTKFFKTWNIIIRATQLRGMEIEI